MDEAEAAEFRRFRFIWKKKLQPPPAVCEGTGAEPMANAERASAELRQMDDLASSVSPIHSLHPLAKLIVTISYVLATVSFDRYELTALSGMILYPAALFALSGIPVRTCLH